MMRGKGREMTESEVVDLKLSANLLRLMMDEKIPFEKKKGKADYLIKVGADVNANVYGKSIALWAKEFGDEEVIKYIKENGGVEAEMSKEKRKELGNQFWDDEGEVKSVKEIKELVLMGADLGVYNKSGYLIWDDLSFEEMNEILKDLPRGYVIDWDVRLDGFGLTELPDFSKIKVGGDFRCYNNQLTSLEGVPSEVGGSFDCSENQLTTLEGVPSKVGGGFYCYKNQLTDLKGAPSEVGGDFDCCDSGLTTLEGAPEKVGGHFVCRYNQLTTLEGKPLKIGGEFKIEDEVLARIEELEKQKKNNAVMGAMTDKFEM